MAVFASLDDHGRLFSTKYTPSFLSTATVDFVHIALTILLTISKVELVSHSWLLALGAWHGLRSHVCQLTGRPPLALWSASFRSGFLLAQLPWFKVGTHVKVVWLPRKCIMFACRFSLQHCMHISLCPQFCTIVLHFTGIKFNYHNNERNNHMTLLLPHTQPLYIVCHLVPPPQLICMPLKFANIFFYTYTYSAIQNYLT
jgi:hypothetical protein